MKNSNWKCKDQLKIGYLVGRFSDKRTKGKNSLQNCVKLLDASDQRDNLGSLCKKVRLAEGGADYSEPSSN